MALIHHKWYDTDLTVAVTPSGTYSHTCMSWSHADPHTRETVVVLLLSDAPALQDVGYEGVEQDRYALKIIHFAHRTNSNASVDSFEVEESQGDSEEEGVHSAVFEVAGPLDEFVVKGTGGVVFLSARHFFMRLSSVPHSGVNVGVTEEETIGSHGALDRFLFTEKQTWERQRCAIRPLRDEKSIYSKLYKGSDGLDPQLLLVSQLALHSDVTADFLLLVAREEAQPEKVPLIKRLIGASAAGNDPRLPTHTFLVAVVRCTISDAIDAVAEYELLGFCAESNVPFQHYTREVAAAESNRRSRSGTSVNTPPLQPTQCIWCYIHNASKGRGDVADGMLFALVPQEAPTALHVVCGAYDEASQGFRIGLVNRRGARGDGVQSAEERDKDGLLRGLCGDEYMVQMVLLGSSVEPLHKEETTMLAPGEVQHGRRHRSKFVGTGASNSSWMRQCGLSMVVRFYVRLADDVSCNGAVTQGHDSKSGNHRDTGPVGLHVISSTLWEGGCRSRFPLPRSVCWIGTVPLPIGVAAASTVLFNPVDEGYGVHMNFQNEGAGAVSTVSSQECMAHWCYSLPTSIASSLPVCVGGNSLRCFVSVNTLLQRSQLTYVLGLGCADGFADRCALPASLSSRFISQLLYMIPASCRRSGAWHVSSDDSGSDDKCQKCGASLAAYMARMLVGTARLPEQASGVHLARMVVHVAWQKIALLEHYDTAVAALKSVAVCGALPAGVSGLAQLGNALRRFIIAFMIEFDWIAPANTDVPRALVLLVLGAEEALEEASALKRRRNILDSWCGGLSARGTKSSDSCSSQTDVRRCVHLLLCESRMWQRLASVLLAWVCRCRDAVGGRSSMVLPEDIPLEKALWPFQEYCGSSGDVGSPLGATKDRAHITTAEEKTSTSTAQNIMQRLHASQSAPLFQDTVSALFRSGFGMSEVASLAVWSESWGNLEQSVLWQQAAMCVCAKFEEATTAGTPSVCELANQCSASVADALARAVPSALELIRACRFDIFSDWKFPRQCGALPVVYLLSHIPPATRPLCLTNSEDGVKGDGHQCLLRAISMLKWLCGDDAEQSCEVFRCLCTAKVALMDLSLVEEDSACCFAPSVSETAQEGGKSRIAYLGRALHCMLLSSSNFLLSQTVAFAIDEAGKSPNINCNKVLGLRLWSIVMEADVAAAFNKTLLMRLYHSLCLPLDCEGPHARSRAASLLMEFARPVFCDALPRLTAVLRGGWRTVHEALAMSPNNVTQSLPIDVHEEVPSACREVLLQMKKLLELFANASLKVSCLSLLFDVFQLSVAALLGQRDVNGDNEDEIFAFAPAEMFFIATQISSNDMGCFVVVSEVMRRSLRQYLFLRLGSVLGELGGHLGGNEVSEYLDSVADSLNGVTCALQETSPLYAHTFVLLFLGEMASPAEIFVTGVEGRCGEAVSCSECENEELYRAVSLWAKQEATAQWAVLQEQEKSIISRVISCSLRLTFAVEAGCATYKNSEAHNQVVRDVARLKASLQRSAHDPAILQVIVGASPTAESTGEVLSPVLITGGVADGVEADRFVDGATTSDTECCLFIRGESYVRSKLILEILRGYDMLVNSDKFHADLAVLYLALREEQRRRRFVEFVLEEKGIISAFSLTFCATKGARFERDAHRIREKELEFFNGRVSFMLRQEREGRTAIQVLWRAWWDIFATQEEEQRVFFDVQERMRLALVNEEENERDTFHESFARGEAELTHHYGERFSADVGQQEEWRREHVWQRRGSGVGGAIDCGSVTRADCHHGSQFSSEQELQPVASVFDGEVSKYEDSAKREVRGPSARLMNLAEESVSPAGASVLGADCNKHVHSPIAEPALALDSLCSAEGLGGGGGGGTGYQAALMAPVAILGAFEKLQRQIITTVAPPPKHILKRDNTTSHQEHGHSPKRPAHQEADDDGWSDSFYDVEYNPRDQQAGDCSADMQQSGGEDTTGVCGAGLGASPSGSDFGQPHLSARSLDTVDKGIDAFASHSGAAGSRFPGGCSEVEGTRTLPVVDQAVELVDGQRSVGTNETKCLEDLLCLEKKEAAARFATCTDEKLLRMFITRCWFFSL
ncbi:hypothetical protein ERJ75_001016000 [Trypanosoma vivax]|nr:hypothetical protein ERJ75_001016000 [Trypanosoma vivax]